MRLPFAPTDAGGRRGFTLVEMLVVAAIIAILAALLAPAAQSLMGVSGRRGGMNALSSAIEQARLRAVEKGGSVYVGFPLSATNADRKFSSVLIFDSSPGFSPVGRWIRFPSGVYYEPGANFPTQPVDGIPAGAIPELDGERLTSLHALQFDRFGRLAGSDGPVQILVGEKPDPEGDFLRSDNNHFELTVQPLTGRVTIRDRSANP